MLLPINPVAQSFFVASPATQGVFLSSVELFFKSVSSDPSSYVWFEIRNMVDGLPGTRVVPFSSIRVYGGTPQVYSQVLDNPMKMVFESPVYLKADQEYCFVVGASSTDYEIFTATLGEEDLNGNVVSKQPYSGVMFLSSNGSTWTAVQETDVSFRLNRCVFDTSASGSLTLVPESNSFLRTLPEFSISTTASSNVVVITDPGHGLKVGDTFVIEQIGNSPSTINGIPYSEFVDTDSAGDFIPRTVTARTFETYTFNTVSNASSSGTSPGRVKIRTHLKADVINNNLQYVEFPSAPATFSLNSTRWSDGVLVSDQNTETNVNINMELPQKLEWSDPTTYALIAAISSSDDFLSPAIDVKDSGVIAVTNKINSIADNDTSELAASGGDSISKYLSKTINLKNTANSCTVLLVANITFGTNIRVYFKGVNSLATDIGIEDQTYVEMERLEPIEYDDFIEYSFRLPLDSSGLDITDDFDNYKIKVVFVGDSDISTRVPTISQFRAIATTI